MSFAYFSIEVAGFFFFLLTDQQEGGADREGKGKEEERQPNTPLSDMMELGPGKDNPPHLRALGLKS